MCTKVIFNSIIFFVVVCIFYSKFIYLWIRKMYYYYLLFIIIMSDKNKTKRLYTGAYTGFWSGGQ